ncbi:MAG TPA: GNAT family protein [Kouleothrix sp.]|uniref:GNAT family N-acetyltransferase n=1 Tax=Kouleothrix sp. TaxID=2779161 RepID=UPI002C1E26DC|nr:GNAT family protein [Kouleothrix sp.]HRC75254.1 GNAT family protein [Kouleothrix sp.]
MTSTSEPAGRPEVIPGERIFLSHVLREDVPLYGRWFSDLELNTYVGLTGNSYTTEHEQAWYDNMVHDSSRRIFSIVLREDGRTIGNVSFNRIEERKRAAELGIAIGDKSAWSQGYGTEALRLMCDYGFTFLSLHTIYLWFTEFNKRGQRAYRKAGFRDAGRIRGGELFDGRHYDRVLMDITREDFGPTTLGRLIGQLPT